jgi:hypothetical protein
MRFVNHEESSWSIWASLSFNQPCSYELESFGHLDTRVGSCRLLDFPTRVENSQFQYSPEESNFSERLCERSYRWFDRWAPDRPNGFAPKRSFSDYTDLRLGWTRFILNQELHIMNIFSGTKSFHPRVIITKMHIKCRCIRERFDNIFPAVFWNLEQSNHWTSRSLSAISRGFGLTHV